VTCTRGANNLYPRTHVRSPQSDDKSFAKRWQVSRKMASHLYRLIYKTIHYERSDSVKTITQRRISNGLSDPDHQLNREEKNREEKKEKARRTGKRRRKSDGADDQTKRGRNGNGTLDRLALPRLLVWQLAPEEQRKRKTKKPTNGDNNWNKSDEG
jgi:hypothetical protein